jgi:prepilin-type N-terminal cleavage/methylation domain-containing protein
MKNQTLSKSYNTGLTLIELLVTMAISSALLITLAALITQATDGYALSQKSINHLSQTRAFLQLFESELTVYMPDTPLIHHSSDVAGPEGSDRIAFVRTIPGSEKDNGFLGDLTTSCYYVAFTKDSKQGVIPTLFRKVLNPTETQNLIEADIKAEFPDVDPNLDEPVIDFVVSFHAVPMYLDPISRKFEPWDKTAEHSPSYIQLNILTIDESLSHRITNHAEWDRLAVSPKPSELKFMRTISHNVSIGK